MNECMSTLKKRTPILGVVAALLLLFVGCQHQDLSMNEHVRAAPLRWSVLESPQFVPQTRSKTMFLEAPDQESPVSLVSGFEDPELLSKMISLKVERSWIDGENIKFIVALKNDTDKGTRATFYRFGHDKLGRVVSTQRKEIFFKPYESIFEAFQFPKSGVETHWSFSVK
jgi:hypothetical protein